MILRMIEARKSDPRARFFNEEGSMLPPFHGNGWRGCAIDRDKLDHTNMPRELFEAIVAAASPPHLLLAKYSPDSGASQVIEATWEAFRAYVFAPENWSLEFVLYDPSGEWAVLADADVTVFGANPELAVRVDAELSHHGLSLSALTERDFPGLDPAKQPGAAYLLAITGRWPRVGEI